MEFMTQRRPTIEELTADLSILVRIPYRRSPNKVVICSVIRTSLDLYGRIHNINSLSDVEQVEMFTERCMNGQILVRCRCAA